MNEGFKNSSIEFSFKKITFCDAFHFLVLDNPVYVMETTSTPSI